MCHRQLFISIKPLDPSGFEPLASQRGFERSNHFELTDHHMMPKEPTLKWSLYIAPIYAITSFHLIYDELLGC